MLTDSSATVIVELDAAGASFTGVTLMVVPALTVVVPSDTAYVKVVVVAAN